MHIVLSCFKYGIKNSNLHISFYGQFCHPLHSPTLSALNPPVGRVSQISGPSPLHTRSHSSAPPVPQRYTVIRTSPPSSEPVLPPPHRSLTPQATSRLPTTGAARALTLSPAALPSVSPGPGQPPPPAAQPLPPNRRTGPMLTRF